MSDVRSKIEAINSKDTIAIKDCLASSEPVLIFNAIIGLVRFNIRQNSLNELLKKQETNDDELMHVRIGDVATAALDVLEAEKYDGDDIIIKRLIKDMRDYGRR